MGKNVIISLKGTQTGNADDSSDIEFVTEGRYYKKDGTYYVSYKETEMTGMEGTTTTLKIEQGKVTMTRFGSTNSQLIFERGQKHMSYYDTQYGAFTIGVQAQDVKVNVNEMGGEIAVDYKIEIDNHPQGMNDFHMHIREIGEIEDFGEAN